MTYDMGSGFSKVSTFNAPMRQVPTDPLGQPMKRWNNVTGAVQYYEQHGVPADRIVLGVPYYGRGFHVTQAGPNHGLFQPWDTSFDPGSWSDMKKLLTDPAWEQHWDPNAQSPWLYNAAEQKFVSFENPRSIGIRSDFARHAGLRGAFAWEIAEDDSAHSMLNAMAILAQRGDHGRPCRREREGTGEGGRASSRQSVRYQRMSEPRPAPPADRAAALPSADTQPSPVGGGLPDLKIMASLNAPHSPARLSIVAFP